MLLTVDRPTGFCVAAVSRFRLSTESPLGEHTPAIVTLVGVGTDDQGADSNEPHGNALPATPEAGGEPPRSLFRYRPASDLEKGFCDQLLLTHQLYFPSVEQLNDPFELDPARSLKIDERQRLAYEKRIRQNGFANSSRADWKRMRDLFRRRAQDAEFIKDSWVKQRLRYGILSMSQTPSHELMWAHYAGSHQGFCVELCRGPREWRAHLLPMRVEYSRQRPSVALAELMPIVPGAPHAAHEFVRKTFLTKSYEWQYEQEWRIVRDTPRKCAVIPASAIVSLTLGARMRLRDRYHCAHLALLRDPPLPLYEMTVDSTLFALNRIPVDLSEIRRLARHHPA